MDSMTPIETQKEKIIRFGRVTEVFAICAFIFLVVSTTLLNFSQNEKIILYIISFITLIFALLHHFLFYRFASHKLALLEDIFGVILLPVFIYFSGGIESKFFFLYFAPLVLTVLVFSVKELIFVSTLIILAQLITFYYQLGSDLFILSHLTQALVQICSVIIMAIFTAIMSQELLVERRAKEKLAQINATKDEFIAIASHYLRTPLTVIRGNLTLLSKSNNLQPNQNNFIQNALANTNKLTVLAEQLLDLSKQNLSGLSLIIQPTDLISIVKGIQMNFQAISQIKGIPLIIESPSILPHVKIDREKIMEAISILIDNSFKFSDSGQIKICLTNTQKLIKIQVIDQGIGIDKKIAPTLFQKFHRGTDYMTMRYQGVGLGLYIAKQIIEAHKGTLTFKSDPNKFTVFEINLPLNV